MAIMPWEVPMPQATPQVIEKTVTVTVPEEPNMLFGIIEDKIFFGILIGIIIANLLKEL